MVATTCIRGDGDTRICWRERGAIVEPGDGGRWNTVIVTGEGEGGTIEDVVLSVRVESGSDIRGVCVCVCMCVSAHYVTTFKYGCHVGECSQPTVTLPNT